jgi:nitroimidazol reductase NimA-like FMN-containing flavoprotein (pyridoxamine 5'-phosphate oxidase superfamily)
MSSGSGSDHANRADPTSELHAGFSGPDATATPWADGVRRLEDADLAWLTTVRPDGRPHVTPVIFAWLDGAVYFTTGPEERKAKNLEANMHCILTTGCNALDDGLDVVVEGEATLVSDLAPLRRVADGFAAKYLPRQGANVFHAELRDGTFIAEGGTNLLYELRPTIAFGFGKGEFSQTRWRF